MIVDNVERIEAPPSFDGSEGLLAIFVYGHAPPDGVRFFTDPGLSLQVGTIRHPKGYEVPAHVHLPAPRPATITQEVILVRAGVLRVRIYTFSQEMVAEKLLRKDDMVILVAGGHSFDCPYGPVEMLEIKQGPYNGKVRDKLTWGREYDVGGEG